jgi:hypothetical protein
MLKILLSGRHAGWSLQTNPAATVVISALKPHTFADDVLERQMMKSF